MRSFWICYLQMERHGQSRFLVEIISISTADLMVYIRYFLGCGDWFAEESFLAIKLTSLFIIRRSIFIIVVGYRLSDLSKS